ncbi:MAG: divergent polysaccharide deacetylase family protein, partial [Proteobacteria bacterium]|nr:divergent polysaccharide deacetylase family protein [Pseudomonadota bacterium]
DAIPFIKGVNNHMGSKMTTSSTQMYQIFSILKKRNLFFIDSLTTSESLCKPSARLLQLPFAQRDVFIDHIQDPDFIRKQINLLIRIADKHGEAIGIVHPHIITYNILRELLPELQKKVQLVPASQIVRIPS